MLARQAVSAALNVLGPGTAVIGHSLGGALLLDLANDRPFGSMVLLSPAPTEIDRIHADRLLVVTGQFDLPRIPAFVPQIEDAVTGSIEMRTIPWAGHSGYLLQPGPIRMIATWLGGDPSSLRTGHRLMRIFGEILCVIVMAAIWLPGKPILPAPGHTPTKLVWYIASCALATLISGFVTVLPMLHLFSTDYLIGFVLAVGLALIPAWACRMSIRFSQILVSLFAAAAVIAIASTVGSELVHLTLSEGRWWRFGIIAAAVLPLSLADEILLRPIRPWWRAAGAAALTRILLAAFVITGVLTLNRSDAFLVLVIHFVVLFWIALWFAGEWLRRQTQDPLATAIFIALVQAWVFAAIFVVI
jgi:heme/copper-type cytochrome/quinol oxidase subunit 4